MKLIAIPTRDSMVDDHFGHCAYYTVGRQLCISTASGYRVVLRGMAIPTTCLTNVSETAFNFGIFLSRQMQKRPDSRSVPGIRRSQNVDMCCITPASARLMQSMFQFLKPLQRNRASRSGPFICRASLRHKTPPRLSQHTHSSAMVSI